MTGVRASGVAVHQLRHTCVLVQLIHRRLLWFRHAARRPEGEVISAPLLASPPRNLGKLKTWTTTLKEDLGSHPEPQAFICQ